MDIHTLIQTRRSIRKYTDTPVSREVLDRILEAVRYAPSWVNYQPWEVVVVDDAETKTALQACVPTVNPGRKSLVTAPLVLAVCGRLGESGYYEGSPTTEHGDWVMFDLGIACQNLCLAAWAEGLGTLHLGWLDHAAAGRVLGLPDHVKLFELIPLGVPVRPGRDPGRKDAYDFVHHNRFGAPLRRG